MKHYLVIIFSMFLVLQGCKSKEEIAKAKDESTKRSDLIHQVNQNECTAPFFSLKTKVYFETGEMKDNFKLHFRLKKDSVIWVSATYYRMEIARALITPDSLKIMDRKGEKYYAGDFAYFEESFNVEADFYLIQSLILCELNERIISDQLKFSQEEDQYILSEVNKRKLKRTLANEPNSRKETYFGIWIDKELLKVTQLLVNNEKDNRFMLVKYDEFSPVGKCTIPKKIDFTLEGEKELSLQFNYLKIDEETELSMPFRVPDKYERQL